jgi:methylated-DNA-[protein]-cysteine S-methyltransferase
MKTLNTIEMFWYESPVGVLRLESDGKAILVCAFEAGDINLVNATQNQSSNQSNQPFLPYDINGNISGKSVPPSSVIQQCVEELTAYFAGKLKIFSVPLRPSGTDFQERVWAQMTKIPYGETVSYKILAERAGTPRAVRAAGGACHRNPIVIIIPCHRVIGVNGSLTGYGGGLNRKRFLLQLEQHHA